MKLDTVVLVETPEGIDLRAEVVGVVPRSLAYTIDFLLRTVVLVLISIVLAFAGEGGTGVILIVFFVLEWFYPVLFEIFNNGQTIGKKLFAIKVVHDDLTPVRFSASLTRNLLRAADFLPMFYIFGIITLVLSGKFQRLGDLSAGTLVVYKDLEDYKSIDVDHIRTIAPAQNMTLALQAAFVDFCLNRANISVPRQEELANIIRDKIPNKYESSVDYVRGVGKWYLGKR